MCQGAGDNSTVNPRLHEDKRHSHFRGNPCAPRYKERYCQAMTLDSACAGMTGGGRDFDARRDFAHAPLPEHSPLAYPMPNGVPSNEIGVADTSETASEPRELLAMSQSTQPLRRQCQCHVTRANLDPHFVCAILRPKSPFVTRGSVRVFKILYMGNTG